MIFLSSYQLSLLSFPSPYPSLLLLVTLSLLHGDSDTAEMLHLNDILDESHTNQTVSTAVKFFSPAPTPRRDTPAGYHLWQTTQSNIHSDSSGSGSTDSEPPWSTYQKQIISLLCAYMLRTSQTSCFFNGVPFTPLQLLPNASAHRKPVSLPLHREARFFFGASLCPPVRLSLFCSDGASDPPYNIWRFKHTALCFDRHMQSLARASHFNKSSQAEHPSRKVEESLMEVHYFRGPQFKS